MAIPIWKDITVNLGTSAMVDYRIRRNTTTGAIIYTGRSNRRPGATANTIKINSVIADYFTKGLPGQGDTFLTFVVEYRSGASWVSAGSFVVQNDWSYDYAYLGELSAPITHTIDGRGVFHRTVDEDVQSVHIEFQDEDGSVEAFEDITPDEGDVALDLSDYPYPIMEVDGERFRLSLCHRYTLHYVNAFGGWDQLLIEGNTVESDSIDRKQLEHTYDNAYESIRGRENYHNGIRTTMVMHTGILTDEESLRMHHLMESTSVFVFDSANGSLRPAIVTNTEVEKRINRNGRQLVSYEIVVELANDKQRR